MPTFQVTLNFSFERHHSDDEEEYESTRTSKRKQKDAFALTDNYYEEHDVVQYIKQHDAREFVEFILSDGEILWAHWDHHLFAIHMMIETQQTAEELREDLQTTSLEDGEYESCGETGWVLFTRGDKGEVFDGTMPSDAWEYGLTDYRENPILIEEQTYSDSD